VVCTFSLCAIPDDRRAVAEIAGCFAQEAAAPRRPRGWLCLARAGNPAGARLVYWMAVAYESMMRTSALTAQPVMVDVPLPVTSVPFA
jgi:hypothetical protein